MDMCLVCICKLVNIIYTVCIYIHIIRKVCIHLNISQLVAEISGPKSLSVSSAYLGASGAGLVGHCLYMYISVYICKHY